ncbi:MAG: DcaP family trimeric outer membrane transporter [Spongiibacteraceae bacterium]
MKKISTLLGVIGLTTALPATASFDFELANGDKISFGGYIKVDARYVDGDVKYQDYWRGNNPGEGDTSHFGISVKETRFNTKYTHGDVSAFVEMDFYGGGGNEVATNSSNPRLRHAYIQYKNIIAGQNWSTFMPLAALPETLDFAGPLAGEVFIRQPQIRYTYGGFKVAIENPETWGDDGIDAPGSGGGTVSEEPDKKPDLAASYTFKGEWGEVTAAALARWLEQKTGDVSETAFAANVSGKINVGKDDIRFQVNVGESGRYIGAGMTRDIVINPDTGEYEVEETTAYSIAYRHLWSDNWRSTVYYGAAETDVLEYERSQWGVNVIRKLTPDLWAGVEVGNFAVDDKGSDSIDSDYVQFSMKFSL